MYVLVLLEMFEGQQEQILSVLHKFADDSDSDVKRFSSMIRKKDMKVQCSLVNGNWNSDEESMDTQEREWNDKCPK